MTCNDELKDRFSIIIARNLDEIRNNFIIGLRKIGYSFDEMDLCQQSNVSAF